VNFLPKLCSLGNKMENPENVRRAIKLVSGERRHNSSQNVHHHLVNPRRHCDRQTNERRSHTGEETIHNNF
jgi:hypothetical protein